MAISSTNNPLSDAYDWVRNQTTGKKTSSKSKQPTPRRNLDPIQLDPYEISDPDSLEMKMADLNRIQNMGQMDFNPMRQNAIGSVNAGVESSNSSTLGALARSGGLSAADRIGAGSEMAKQKSQGTASVMGKLNELQAKNQFDVGRFNTDQRNNLYLKNLELQNRQNEYNTGNINENKRLQDKLEWERQMKNAELEADNRTANAMG